MYRFLALIIVLGICARVIAQQNPIKYGKVDNEHWQLQKVSYDSTANAVVLCDFGTLKFGYGVPTAVTQHRRIKILNEKGLDQANIVLPFYAKNNNEKIISLKAQTLNLVDGKVENYKVEEFYEADINANWKSENFSFPNVKAGSIIEYSYTKMIENNLSFEDWEFQSDIPTLHSEYQATISQGLDVKIFFGSNRLYQKYGQQTTNRWYLQNLPAHKKEEFCPNPQDYLERISFQLAGYYRKATMGGTEYVDVMTNWKDLANEIYNYPPIFSYLSKKIKARDLISNVVHSSFSAEEKVKVIYNFVNQNFEFNGKTRMYTELDFNEFLEVRKGNSAEINLLLVALLREADLEADPVLISTKDHGVMREGYPLLDQFNKTLASVVLNGKIVLLDATDPYLPYDLLPKEDLNQKALVYNRSKAEWIKVENPEKSQKTMFVMADLSGDTAKYNVSLMASGYYAAELRKKLAGNAEKKEILKMLIDEDARENIDSIRIKHLLENEEKLVISLYLSDTENPLRKNDPMHYYEPPGIKNLVKNPFTQAERELPVDLYYKSYFSFQYAIMLPQDLVVNEIPESIKFVMPTQKADFIYQVQSKGQNVQMHIKLNHTDHYFTPYEYPNLRQMYTLIADKLSQPIVLEKKRT